jgi:two-component system, OmpR family, sensor histidine kinase KdpD
MARLRKSMRRRSWQPPQILHGDLRPPLWEAALAAAISVAAATAAIYALKQVAPVVSLSVVYLPAVLLIASIWGVMPGLLTSVLSAAAFNFFHIPPIGKFSITDSRNWVALVAFITVSLVASGIAELARSRSAEAERRRAEADLAAVLARELLGGTDTRSALGVTAHRLALALDLSSSAIELGAVSGDARRNAIPLIGPDGAIEATLLVPSALPADAETRLQTRVVPTLEALISVALSRDELQADAVQTAALRRSDEVKTALLRAVSHDLRTPITAIVAAGHALGSPSLTAEDREELAEAVRTEGERLGDLVEKLLDLSRLQGGGITPRLAWVSLADIVLTAADSGGLPGNAVRTSFPEDLPEVRADAALLERVFANLLQNGWRYGQPEPVQVNAVRSGEKVVVQVVDRGPGIPSAELERIFEPFYRGAGNEHVDHNGSGLGLAIARGFVNAGGGELIASSLPGQGTTFSVTLPIDPAAAR